eukprot:7089381-Pyramimonas_sp.AAC.1
MPLGPSRKRVLEDHSRGNGGRARGSASPTLRHPRQRQHVAGAAAGEAGGGGAAAVAAAGSSDRA